MTRWGNFAAEAANQSDNASSCASVSDSVPIVQRVQATGSINPSASEGQIYEEHKYTHKKRRWFRWCYTHHVSCFHGFGNFSRFSFFLLCWIFRTFWLSSLFRWISWILDESWLSVTDLGLFSSLTWMTTERTKKWIKIFAVAFFLVTFPRSQSVHKRHDF